MNYLDNLTVPELKQLVKVYNLHTIIKGYSKMKKVELITSLNHHLRQISNSVMGIKPATISIAGLPKIKPRPKRVKLTEAQKQFREMVRQEKRQRIRK